MENPRSLPAAGVLNQRRQRDFVLRVGHQVATYLSKTGRNNPALALFHECLKLSKFFPRDQRHDRDITETTDRVLSREMLLLTLYTGISMAYFRIGDLKSAIKYRKLTVKLEEKGPLIIPSALLWSSYEFLGKLYGDTGYFMEAIESLEKALGYARDNFQKGQVYIHLSDSYLELGNTEKATEFMKKAKDIVKEGNTPQLEMDYFYGAGRLFYHIGDYTKALACYEKELLLSRAEGDKAREGKAYAQLGKMYCLINDPMKALENQLIALNTAKEFQDGEMEKEQCFYIALHYLQLGGFERARYYCARALSLSHKSGDLLDERITYLVTGLIQEKVKNLGQAIDCYEQCIGACEEIERLLGQKDEYKVSISEVHIPIFLTLTEVLIKDGQEIRALPTADRGRTRALADLMKSNYGIKAANVAHVKRLSVKEIQQMGKNMASRKSTFLITAINETRVYLWHLASDGNITFRQIPLLTEKPGKDHIQSIVDMSYEELRHRDRKDGEKCEDRSLPSRQDKLNSERPRSAQTASDDLVWRVIRMETWKADSSPDKQEPLETTGSSLRVLYNLIVAPVADLLDQGNEENPTEELVFAPDGPLCLVPFSALQGPDGKSLIEKYRIRVIPSLITLNQILRSPPDYHSNSGALIVGDPDVGNVQYNGKLENISRLPCAKIEAKMVGKFLKVKPLTGHKATKEEVLSRMTSVSLVHLAAHGNPNRGEIALAPVISGRSGPIEEKDYLLSMADVQSVKLRAKLVVLSCCHSGRGDIKAEGVVGIARAFLGAGARSVLVSLWDIGDAATEYFMYHFYLHLVRGESASVALHQATKEMKNSEDYSEARYWAPFMLIGDDVTISISDQKERENP